MAADSSVAEKLDLDMVSRKASNASESFDPNKPVTKRYEEIHARLERLREMVEETKNTARQMTEVQGMSAAPSEAVPPVTATITPRPSAPAAKAPVQAATSENSTATRPAVPPIAPPREGNPVRATVGRPGAAAPTSFRPREVPPKAQPNIGSPAAATAAASAAAVAARKLVEAAKNSAAPIRPAANTSQAGTQNQAASQTATASVPVSMADVQKWKKLSKKKDLGAIYKVLPDIGIWATGAWLAGAVLYLGGEVGWANVLNMPAHQLGSVIAGIAAPIALIWMGVNYLRRHQDIKEQMAPLMAQIDQLINPNKAIEARIDAVADGLRRQANELITATQQVEKTLNHVRDGLRTDMEKMVEYAGLTGKHLEQASTSMANRTTQLARMTEQMHGRLATFEEHAKSGSERLDQSVNDMMSKAQGATDKLERQSNNIIAALHAANMRMVRTADDLDSRIGQIANFADQTAARFGGIAAEFARHGAVVDTAGQVMREQLTASQEQFAGQLTDMGSAISNFATLGSNLTGAVTGFRDAAEHVVVEASQQINKYTETMQTRLETTVKLMAEAMDERLHQSQASLDRSIGTTVSKVTTLDRMMAQRLEELQTVLTDAADETPRMVESILNDTTRRLLDMDTRFGNSGAHIADQLKTLERNIDVRLQAMGIIAERMSEDATDSMKQSMISIFNELQEIQEQFTGSARDTNSNLKTFHNDLAQTIEALGHVARRATDRTVERILMLNAGVSQRIMDLRETAETAASAGRETAVALTQHIGMAREVNDQISQATTRMVSASTGAAADLRDASGQAMAQAEIVSHVIGREAQLLRTATADAAASLDDAGSTLEMARSQLYASVSATAQLITDIVRDLQSQQNNFDATTQSSAQTHAAMYQEIMRLRDVTQALNGQLKSTALATDERAQEIRGLTTRLGEVTLGMKAAIQSGQAGLNDSADRLENIGSGTRDALMAQSTKLADIAEQIALRSYSIANSFEKQQREIQQNATQGAATIETMVEKMRDGVAAISLSAESSARDLDWLCRHIQSAGEAVEYMGEQAQDAMNRAREAMVVSEASLQRSTSSARLNLSELAARYSAEGVRVNGISGDLAQSYDSAIKRLESLGHELAGQSFLTFDTLSELGTLFDARIAQLRDGGDLANSQLNNAVEAIERNHQALITTADMASQQLAEINNQLAQTQQSTDMSTDHARTRVEAVRRELSAYAQDLMMMVAQASGQIDAAAAGFGAKADAVRGAANENINLMGEMGARVRGEIETLVRLVNEAMQPEGGVLNAAVDRLRQQSEALMRQTQQSFQEMERYSARAVQSAQTIEQKAGRAAQQVQTAGAQFTRQGEQMAAVGQEAAKRIARASQVVQDQTQNMKSVSERAAAVMAGSGQQVQQILANITQQLTQIERANTQAGETVQRLTQSENRARRDVFLNTAKFIVEGLNSLAIDLTRVLDAQEAARVWAEFSKGDTGAFTRRFVQMRDDIPMQRLRQRYENDNEFRTYVARYFRQFEELFEQAIATDHNDLLATTLTTSDVGKLYTYLAGALGHNKLKARAA